MRFRQISERIPAGRWGDPKDFAGPVVFLASAASQYVCGEILVVDGVKITMDTIATNPLTTPFTRAGWVVEPQNGLLIDRYLATMIQCVLWMRYETSRF